MAEDFFGELGLVTDPNKVKRPTLVTKSELATALEDAKAKQETVGFLGGLGIAGSEGVIPTAYEFGRRKLTDANTPIKELTDEDRDFLIGNLSDPQAKLEVLTEAKVYGMERATMLKTSFERQQLNASTVAASGWTGIAGQAMGEMFDAGEWAIIGGSTLAATALTSPVGGAATFAAGAGNRARKAYNVVRSARVGAGIGILESAAFEALQAEQRYDTDANDMWIAMGLGATIGGMAGGLSTVLARRKAVSEMSLRLTNGETLDDFTEAERAFYREYNVDATALRMLERHADEIAMEGRLGLDSDTVPMETAEGEVPTMETVIGTTWVRRMASSGARAGTSKVSQIRNLGMKMSHNPGNAKDVAGRHVPTEEGGSVTEIQELVQLQFRNEFDTTFHRTFKTWRQRTGGTMADFNALATKYERGILKNTDAEVEELVAVTSRQKRQLAEMNIEANAAGFVPEILKRHKNYVPRIYNAEKIRNLRIRLGANANVKIAKLIKESIISEQPAIIMDLQASLKKKLNRDISLEEAEQKLDSIVDGFTDTITQPQIKMAPTRQFEYNLDDLEQILYDRGHVTDEIDSILEAITVRNPAKGIKRTRPRFILDEGYTIEVEDVDGNLINISFDDLLENDAYQLHQAYLFQTSGSYALAKKGIDTNDPNTSFANHMAKATNEIRDRNLVSDDHEAELSGLQFLYDGVTGRLAERGDVSNRFRENAIAWRAFSFAVHMGSSGLSASMELSNVVFDTAVRVNIMAIPELGRILNLARQGRLGETNIVDEVVHAFGVGEEVALGRYSNSNRYDDGNMEGAVSAVSGGSVRDKIDILQQKVAYWSGLQGVTQTLRRLNSLNFANSWGRAVKKGKIPFKRAQLAQLGLSDRMVIRIMDNMEEFSDIKDSGRLTALNLDAWEADVREAFMAAGYKNGRNNVQEMNLGSTNRYMRSETSKIYAQFLAFPMGAMEHQTMRLAVRGKQGDFIGASRVVMAGALQGTLLYITRVHLNSLGREDREEYLKRNLTIGKIALGALSQVGASSIFGLIYGSGSSLLGYQGNPITPPIFSMIGGAGSGLFNITKDVLYDGDPVQSSDIRKVLRIAPAQSLYGVSQALNAVASEFGR